MADLVFLGQQLPNLLFGLPAQRPGGLLLTLLLLAASVPAGFLLAMPAALLRRAGETATGPLTRWGGQAVAAATTVVRGLPLVLLLLLVVLIVTAQPVRPVRGELLAAWLALTLYTAAYQTEILLGGLRAVPGDVLEAARAAGLPGWSRLGDVQVPVAARAALPALTGQTISLFKDTSVVLIVGVPELFTTANHILNNGREDYFVAMYVILGALYFGPAWAIGQLAGWIERRPRFAGLHSGMPATG